MATGLPSTSATRSIGQRITRGADLRPNQELLDNASFQRTALRALLEVQALIEHLPIEKARPHHCGQDAEDDDHHDQLDHSEAALHGDQLQLVRVEVITGGVLAAADRV